MRTDPNLRNILKKSIQEFLTNDQDLFRDLCCGQSSGSSTTPRLRPISERACSTRIAMSLAKNVGPIWDVDCEYNRVQEDGNARIKGPEDSAGNKMRIIPDIIVHQRRTTNNRLIIEIKTRVTLRPSDQSSDQTSWKKLNRLKRLYGYSEGVFVDLGLKSTWPPHPRWQWVTNDTDSLDLSEKIFQAGELEKMGNQGVGFLNERAILRGQKSNK